MSRDPFTPAELATLRQAARDEGLCEGCGDARAVTESPQLCATCAEEYYHDTEPRGCDAGCACTGNGCAWCGRCCDGRCGV